MTEHLSDDDRQMLLRLIDGRLAKLARTSPEVAPLIAIRRKLEGTDKRISVETTKI